MNRATVQTVVLAGVVACAWSTMAFAQSGVLLQTCQIALDIWVWLRGIVYLLAAIALAFMSMQASILGKFSMGKLVSWGGALFLLSSAPAAVAFLTSGSFSTLNCDL